MLCIITNRMQSFFSGFAHTDFDVIGLAWVETSSVESFCGSTILQGCALISTPQSQHCFWNIKLKPSVCKTKQITIDLFCVFCGHFFNDWYTCIDTDSFAHMGSYLLVSLPTLLGNSVSHFLCEMDAHIYSWVCEIESLQFAFLKHV